MKMGEVQKLVLYFFSCLNIFPFILLLLFCLSVSENKHQNFFLISTTYNFNPVFLFFMLIFMTIFLSLGSSSEPACTGDFDNFLHLFPLVYEIDSDKMVEQYEDSYVSSDEKDCREYDAMYEEDNINADIEKEDIYGDHKDDENDNEDLQRRIEEFIAKVNRKWREELLADRLLCLTAPA